MIAANDAATSAAVNRGADGTIGADGVVRKSARTWCLLLSTDTTTVQRADKTLASSSSKNFLKVLLTETLPKVTLLLPTTPSSLACKRKASSKSTDRSVTRPLSLDDDSAIAARLATCLRQNLIFMTFKPKGNLQGFPSTNSDRSQAIDHTFLQLSSPCTFAFHLGPWPLALESISEYWTGHEQLGPKKISAKHHQVY